MATGYKFPYKGVATDIADIAAPGYDTTLAPCVYFGKSGFITDNKTGVNDNKFLAVNSDDPWKTGIGVRNVKIKIGDTEQTIHYYSSSVEDYKLTNDIASKYSCPNFKKVIGFYGDGVQPDPTAIKVFERYGKDNKGNTIYQTYRLQVRKWNDGFLISIGEGATNGFNPSNVGQWLLKSNTGTLPTALIVGIQAAGGNGGDGRNNNAGAGGGSGGCTYLVLDWEKARLKVHSSSSDFVKFDFYITPITGWKSIAYPKDTTYTTCRNSCVAINLKDDWHGSSSNEKIKSKCIIGCGQDAYGNKAGAAGIVKNYDLGDDIFGIDTGKIYKDEELSEYGIHILTMRKSDNVTNAGNGGAVASAGYDSNKYWLTTTNKKIDKDYSNYSDDVYQFEHLDKHTGGSTTASSGYGGGGGASNYANGGDGGAYSFMEDQRAGKAGTLGSGGGGAYMANNANGGKGGLPYIFFCSNIDFSITVLEYPDIKLSSTLKEGYSAASDDTYIAYLQKNGDIDGEVVYIYPSTTNIPYPTGCDASNTLLYRNSGSGGWAAPVLMSDISLKTEYATYNDSRSNPHWYYNIVFTKK